MTQSGSFDAQPGGSLDRRDLLARGLLLSAAALTTGLAASAALAEPASARLETRLFNLRPDLAPNEAAAAVARFKAQAMAAAPSAFLIGANEDKTPFPTRHEWLYMVQWPDSPQLTSNPRFQQFQRDQDALAAVCVDQATCEVVAPLPARFADAAGVGVRHVVMFSFKPEATPDDQSRIVEAIRAMGRNSMAKSYVVQPHAPTQISPDHMQWEVIGDFADMADFRAYALAPAHLALRDDFTAHVSRVAFLDVAL